ncbi:MAG: hypothetical protein WC758_00335 [Candidatus Woesearchaeota archaeon]|jgi:hypothetical protein
MKKRGIKGQVTLFIILGLVILIIIGVFLFLISQKKLENIPGEDVFKQDYDAKLAPMHYDVVFCLDKLGKESLIKIGSNAGYLEVQPELYAYDRYVEHTNNALELFPKSEIVIPYWKYIQGPPDCTSCVEVQKIPNLEGSYDSIQQQIERYIEQNLVSCMKNFSDYKADLTITYLTPNVTVQFRDENTFIGLTWPINVIFPNDAKSESLKYFSTTLDLKMKKMYDLAVATLFQMEMIEDVRAFEYFTSDVLTFYSFGGENADIPPVAGPTVIGISSQKHWLLRDVKETLKTAISENVNYMQVIGSKDSFYPYEMDAIDRTTYAKLQNKIYGDEEYISSTRIRFNYFPNWPMYVSVNPGGEVIMPKSTGIINLLFLQLGSTSYEFAYDISYPVLVTLEDDEAFKGEGYLFQYPFEVNIRNNKPYSNDSIFIKSSDFPEFETNQYSMYSQRTVPVKLNIINGFNERPETDIIIGYTCADTTIAVGVSELKDGQAVIETMLPPCLGGFFGILNREYSMDNIYQDVILDSPINLLVKVYPEKEITISVEKKNFAPSAPAENIDSKAIDRKWIYDGGAGTANIMVDEEVIVLMTEVRKDTQQPRAQFVVLNITNDTSVVMLTPGLYNVQIISMLQLGEGHLKQNITIPNRTMNIKDDFLSTTTFVINETVINESMYLGGLSFDETTGYLNVTFDNLTFPNLVFVYPSYDPIDLKYIEDLNVLSAIQAAQTNPSYIGIFNPRFE